MNPQIHPLSFMLQAAVPFKIQAIHDRGGITSVDFAQAQAAVPYLECADAVLLYKSGVQGESAAAFTAVAEAIAVLAFCPEGVELFGTHYDASIPFPYVRSSQKLTAPTLTEVDSEGEPFEIEVDLSLGDKQPC